jgi:hypothetical protein
MNTTTTTIIINIMITLVLHPGTSLDRPIDAPPFHSVFPHYI